MFLLEDGDVATETQIVERLAKLYAHKHEHRAVILVGDKISEAIGSGRWLEARRWHDVREMIWKRHGVSI